VLRIPLPLTDASLLLSPRWGQLPGPLQVLVLLLVCGVPVALVVWLYRYEMRLVQRSTAAVLLTLRLAVLLFLLFVVCLQPIAARSTTERLPGKVLVAVDRSASMDVADPQRPPVDKIRLARALKLAGDICPDAQLDAWVRQYEERGGPQGVAPDEFPGDVQRRRLVSEQRRRQHEQVCRRIDSLTRTQAAERLLAADGVGLLNDLTARHDVKLLGFAREAWDGKPDHVDDFFRPLSPTRGPSSVANDSPAGYNGQRTTDNGQATDLRLPLARGLEQSGPNQGKVLGIVLFTDGQHNWGPSPVAKAIELGQRGLPIYPVALGARRAPPDVAVAGVKAPAAVFKDVDAAVDARVKVSSLPAQELIVELQRPGGPPLRQRIQHDGTDRSYAVRFQVRLERAGTQTLTVIARPVQGETRTDNNRRAAVVNVADDQARVLLVDGEARWEFHYLANALARDRSVKPQSVVFEQPRLGKVSEEDLGRTGNPARKLPAEADALAVYDCIVLGDVSPTELSPVERARLEKYVADRGGTLVVLAGKRSMPLGFSRDERPAEEGDPLQRLLPVEEPRAVRPARGFSVALTHEGRRTSFLQLDPSPDKSTQRWAELPPHYWGVVGRAKPGAVPLAFFSAEEPSQPRRPAAAKGDEEADREDALIVRQHYGFGRVLFVGLDSTWRWRFKTGDTYHHRFWGQLIRWAASDKPLVAGNEHVRFGTQEPVYRQGQEVEIVARLGEAMGQLRGDALAGARVFRQGGEGEPEETAALVPLSRREAQPRVLEGRLRDLPAGQYAIELAIPELADRLQGPPGPDGKPAKLRATFSVTPADTDEAVELATNWPLLEELAAKSGGTVFTPENATELVKLLTDQAVTREVRTERKLWQEWGTLLLLFLLLTVEWVGRKLAGLP
jgi:hypothetical protein